MAPSFHSPKLTRWARARWIRRSRKASRECSSAFTGERRLASLAAWRWEMKLPSTENYEKYRRCVVGAQEGQAWVVQAWVRQGCELRDRSLCSGDRPIVAEG